jgi:DNA-directed RNA polymerase subunit RPC12/RpoP
MFMNVVCPTCGHKCRVPESALGQRVPCPGCANSFQCGSMSPPSLATTPAPDDKPAPVQVLPQARVVPVQPDRAIHYRCPRCRKSLESPAHLADEKVNCPDCGQRLKVPPASTISAAEEPLRVATPRTPTAPSPPTLAPAPEPVPVKVAAAAPPVPARRENCLECGKDVTERPRIQTCPDCSSLFCCAMCYREHRYHAHSSRRR